MSTKIKHIIISLCCLLVLAACEADREPTAEPQSPRQTATVEPAATERLEQTEETVVPQAIASPEPTINVLEPTPTVPPTPTVFHKLAICDGLLEQIKQPDGELFIRYWSGSQVWLWSENAGEIEHFTIEENPMDLNSSPNGRYVAFTRPAEEEGAVELWIANSDGSSERLLTTASPVNLLERYSEAIGADFVFHWIGGGEDLLLAYNFQPVIQALGDLPDEPQTVIDINSGESYILQPAATVFAAVNSPNGQRSAVLVDGAVQILETTTGTVLHTVPVNATALPYQTFAFSPDSNHLVFFSQDGIVLINPADGTFQEIPLVYEPVGLGEYSVTPDIYWLKDGSGLFALVTDNQQVFDKGATFALWFINLSTGEGTLRHTFNGSILSAALSHNQDVLAFWLQDVNNRQLFLADLRSGEVVEYSSGRLIDFLSWNPDGHHFLYWLAEERKPILGSVCEEPITFTELGFPEIADNIRWVDGERFIYIGGEMAESDGSGSWTIYLNNLDGQSQILDTVEGPYPQLEYYFEP